jgi:hypothetical protein
MYSRDRASARWRCLGVDQEAEASLRLGLALVAELQSLSGLDAEHPMRDAFFDYDQSISRDVLDRFQPAAIETRAE